MEPVSGPTPWMTLSNDNDGSPIQVLRPRGLQSNSRKTAWIMQADARQHSPEEESTNASDGHLYRDLHTTPDEPSRPSASQPQQHADSRPERRNSS
ncbi:unnamed protein product [Boreogadus saida]